MVLSWLDQDSDKGGHTLGHHGIYFGGLVSMVSQRPAPMRVVVWYIPGVAKGVLVSLLWGHVCLTQMAGSFGSWQDPIQTPA